MVTSGNRELIAKPEVVSIKYAWCVVNVFYNNFWSVKNPASTGKLRLQVVIPHTACSDIETSQSWCYANTIIRSQVCYMYHVGIPFRMQIIKNSFLSELPKIDMDEYIIPVIVAKSADYYPTTPLYFVVIYKIGRSSIDSLCQICINGVKSIKSLPFTWLPI